MSWPRISIDRLCEAIVDCVNRTAPVVEQPTPFKMIRTTNVKSGWISLSEVRYVDEATYRIWTRRQVPRRGDVVLTREAPLGEVGIIRNDDTVFLGQRLVSYRADLSKLDPRFLLYSLQGSDLQAQIRALGSGSTVEHMRVPDAKTLMVPTPPLKTQIRIADILSAYDDLIENNTRRIAILEDMARRLFEEWFGRAPEAHTADGSIIGTVSEVAAYINRGIAPKYDEDGASLVINQKCIRSQRLSLDPARRQSKSVSTDKVVCAGDVLVNSTGVGTLGRVAQVFDVPPGTTVDTHVTIVRPKPEVNPVWFGLALLNKQTHFEEAGVGSTGQTELSRARIADTELLIPTPERAERFGETVGPMREETYSLEQANTNLRTTRDLLLPKLISGEIEVRVAGDALEAAAG